MFVEDIRDILINVSIALLVWLFTILIFIPLSEIINAKPSITNFISLIGLVGLIKPLYDGTISAIRFSEKMSQVYLKRGMEKKAVMARILIIEIIAILDTIILASLLWGISPILGGIIIIFYIFFTTIFLLINSEKICKIFLK